MYLLLSSTVNPRHFFFGDGGGDDKGERVEEIGDSVCFTGDEALDSSSEETH